MSIFTFRYGDRGTVVSVTGVQPALPVGHWTREWQLSSSRDKAVIIEQLHILLDGDTLDSDFLCQRAELVMDEMLENALYSAPRTSEGIPLFAKGIDREIPPDERIFVRCGFDGEQLFMEVSDSWGNLSPETVEGYLTLNSADSEPVHDRAGRGLFIMWKFMDYFYVNIRPGIETSMGGVLSLHSEIKG
jgi:hypothetical protein